ncbi:MAG: hypothetical protein RLZZ385_2100 [Pseudomonadota bacterium]|jgi:hypothetical protein
MQTTLLPLKPAGLALLTVLAAGCTWVQLTAEGEGVRLATAAEVGNCQRIGNTTATTRSRVAIADRGSEKVQDELITLARNEAGTLGGNVIVADSTIEAGRQRFIVYRCP